MKKRIFMFLAAAMVAMYAHAEPTVTDVTADKKVQANGTYKLLRDAQADLGAVAYDNRGMRVTVVDLHDKVQLWEGGPYWATTNIGAENPEDYGYYFWWGDTGARSWKKRCCPIRCSWWE